MKVLSFQQPWASLIAAGIKDVEKRTWAPQEIPERILIHAIPQSVFTIRDSSPLEWMQIIKNEQIYGNLPDISDMPTNAIIGYVTLNKLEKKIALRSFSLKNENENEYYWHFKDAYLFDEPIMVKKSKLYFWDYDLDENNLPPAHKVTRAAITVNKDNINIPVTENFWLDLTPNNDFAIEFTTLENLVCLPNSYEMKPFKSITFNYEGEQRTFALEGKTGLYKVNGDDDDFYYSDTYDSETRIIIRFFWGEEM